MTLETCKKLLEHYEKIGDKVNADIMRARVERKSKLPKYQVEVKSKGKK